MIAFIPARGGSKGLPGKNIKNLCGKPLIAWAIEGALKAECIDRVIVTTDDEEIAAVAREYGAEVPFMRPDYLASDTSSAIDVYLHAADYMRDVEGEDTSKFIVLLATCPLRRAEHIDAAYEEFVKAGATTLVSMKEADTPPSWYFKKNANGCVENAGFDAGNVVKNRQLNDVYYIPNGAIYILDYELLKNERTYYCDNTINYVMSSEDSVDIDHALDFEMARMIMSQR